MKVRPATVSEMPSPRPMRLYKYLEPARVDVLESGLIAYTPPIRFNDPFDFNPAIDSDLSDECLDEECALFEKQLPPEKHVPREVFKAHMRANKRALDERLSRDLRAMLGSTYGVLCLSEVSDDPLMWSHYAQDHEGFVIEFDLTHNFFRQRMARVAYSADRPVQSRRGDNTDFAFAKAEAWRYEKEWRGIEHLERCETLSVKVGGVGKLIYRHRYPKEAVTAVICGSRMALELKAQLQGQVRSWGFSRCRLLELSLHPRHFAFESSELKIS